MKILVSLMSLILAFSTTAFAGKTVVIDVRTPQEYSEGHVDGALNIDFKDSSFTDKVKALDKEQSYILYCRSGNRSGQAIKIMEGLGFKHLENYGGFEDAKKRLGK